MKAFNSRPELIKMFRKYLDGTATPDEKKLVEAWYDVFEREPEILEDYTAEEKRVLESRMEAALQDRMAIGKRQKSRWHIRAGWVAAASVLLLLLGGGYYFQERKQEPSMAEQLALYDLAPGGNKAVLTLGNGSRISLDSAAIGYLARQESALIRKVEDGLLIYTKEGIAADNEQNTVTVPSGGKYSVVLPDGSKVWLNAASSITFPTTFHSKERNVSITGEVYFEVAKDTRRPFKVNVNGIQEVVVLGTHFNVNAYRDEDAVITTLLEGSVKVLAAGGEAGHVQLKPGEQSALSGKGTFRIQEDINTEGVIAWKNDMFLFEKAGIETVMRQLSRWYNVEVKYEGSVPNRKFSGKIDRNVNASQALEILRFTGVNFRIENAGNGMQKSRIVVTP